MAENAYALLTNIQGFDSFSLSPSSTTDEITRAFQTQSLIWHPDKNPGDEQARAIFGRMQLAYTMLMDPAARKAHDALLEKHPSLAAGRANGTDVGTGLADELTSKPAASRRASSIVSGDGSETEVTAIKLALAAQHRPDAVARQLPPEDLGAPPPSARPFAYVDKEPATATPAAKAGLRRGDALLRVGEASHLRDVQGQLQVNLDREVPALVIDIQGRFLKKWIVPHSWDAWAPASLLGCQMSDQCPVDLQATHPAELAERAKKRKAARQRAAKRLESEHDEELGRGGKGGGSRHLSAGMTPQRELAPCWPRVLLALTSLAGVGLGLTIAVYPAFSYQVRANPRIRPSIPTPTHASPAPPAPPSPPSP